MATKTMKKEKGNRYAKCRYHIPFYKSSFFSAEKDDEEKKMVKLPVKISEEEGETRTNVTSFEIPAIIRFDGDVEDVLQSLNELKTKVIRPRQLEKEQEEVKLTLKMLGLICVGTATQTLQEATKAARKHVYREYLEAEYDIDAVQEEVLIEDEGAFFEYIEREFDDLVEGFNDSEEFTAHLYKVFFQQFWNNLHAVMFGADAYRAFKTQKEYLKNKIVKPLDVGAEASFRRVDILCNLLLLFPPTGSRGRMATPKQWEEHAKIKFIDHAEKREMKYNLLPDEFQERFDELEVDWTEMSHAKFNSEAQKCEEADKKGRQRQEQEQQTNKRKREDQLANVSRKDQARNKKNRAREDSTKVNGGGKARLCELCKAAGAPESVYRSHWASKCQKKDRYAQLLSGGAGSRQKAQKELSASEKKLRREFKLMVKKVKQLESKQGTKRRRRGENSDDSSFASSSDEGF